MPFPINLDTVNQLFGTNLSIEELPEFFERIKEPVGEIKSSADVVLCQVGSIFYEKIYKNYTLKQWGVTPDKLDPKITSRVPVRENRDDRYFNDPYQGLPEEGYTRVVEKMLSHPNIRLILGVDYKEIIDNIEYKVLVYTGPIDYYFNYKYGKLPYRSLELRLETHDVEYYQPVAVVNYPNDYDFTRITEFKHMTGQKSNRTSILKEYPREATADDEPYYPAFNEQTNRLVERYRREAENEGVFFVGRLAEYEYYNMDTVVARALQIFNSQIAGQRHIERNSIMVSSRH